MSKFNKYNDRDTTKPLNRTTITTIDNIIDRRRTNEGKRHQDLCQIAHVVSTNKAHTMQSEAVLVRGVAMCSDPTCMQ